jgi:hypothetical protein
MNRPAPTVTGIGGKDVTGEVTFLARELKAPLIASTFQVLGDQARDWPAARFPDSGSD